MTFKQLSPALKMNTLEPASPQEAFKLSFLAGKFLLHLLLNDPHFTADLSLELAHIHRKSPTFDVERLRLSNRSIYGKVSDLGRRAIIIMLPNSKKSNRSNL